MIQLQIEFGDDTIALGKEALQKLLDRADVQIEVQTEKTGIIRITDLNASPVSDCVTESTLLLLGTLDNPNDATFGFIPTTEGVPFSMSFDKEGTHFSKERGSLTLIRTDADTSKLLSSFEMVLEALKAVLSEWA